LKLLNAQQIREADQYTIENEPIASIALMERAANKCLEWIIEHYSKNTPFLVFCGTGNNGGDGLALHRLLLQAGYTVQSFILPFSKSCTPDFLANLKRVEKYVTLEKEEQWLDIEFVNQTVIVDALLGSGTQRPTAGLLKKLIQFLNQSGRTILSIDLPSGLFPEYNSNNPRDGIIQARHTLSFQQPKLAFLLPDYGSYAGIFHSLDIGLDTGFIENCPTAIYYTTLEDARALLLPLDKFSHKGTYGHLFLMAGKEGSMGAALLAGQAALHSGLGKLTLVSPKCGLDLLQSHLMEAMVLPQGTTALSGSLDTPFPTLAIGPGIGTHPATADFLKSVLQKADQALVLDADALNLLSRDQDLIKEVPQHSILSPHPKEFERLVGPWKNENEKIEKLCNFAQQHQIYCILKGAHSIIATPEGEIHFNSSGNPGMATAGSGDVLTGILGSFLAQGYSPKASAILGVFLHGLAGDQAVETFHPKAVSAGIIAASLSATLEIVSENKTD